MTRTRATPYQATQRTVRTPAQVLDDLATLGMPDATVGERGDTYIVFTPLREVRYGAGRATAVAVVFAILVLVATAASVMWILLLPASLLAYVPLLVEDHAMLAVGAVDDDVAGVTRLTVHGHAWGDLQGAIDAYLSHLPGPPAAPGEAGESMDGVATPVGAPAADSPSVDAG